jgi:hypothetical protein
MVPTIRAVTSLSKVPSQDRNLGLVVEIPIIGTEGSYNRAAKPEQSINLFRWKYVSDIHVVMPNVRQLYIVRSLERKHYQYDRDELVREVTSSGLPITIHIHEPDQDVLDNAFLKVINVGFDDATKSILTTIPWRNIVSTIHRETMCPLEVTAATSSRKNSAVKPKLPPKRQQYHRDVGYTTGRCLLAKDELGISLPVVKPDTDTDHIAAMVALSALLRSHVFQDLQDTVYFDAVNVDRVSSFAKSIHEDNLLEALRSALSNAQHPCGCHDDSHNDHNPNFSPVITFSMFVEVDGVVYRLAFIGYSRKAIRQYYERRNTPEARAVFEIKKMLETLPSSRVRWAESIKMISGTLSTRVYPRLGDDELGFYADKCHMNCFRYLSPWIHYSSQLISRFSLPYIEAVGLIVGMYCDNNALSFVLVAKDLLDRGDVVVTTSPINFGLMVRKLMGEKKKQLKAKFGKQFTFPQRFRYCWQESWNDRMLNEDEFQTQKQILAEECTRYRERCHTVQHRNNRVAQFESIVEFVKTNIFGAGDLIPKHIVPVLSVMGILPPWMASMSYLKADSKNYLHLVDKFKIGSTQGQSNAFLRLLSFAVKPFSAAFEEATVDRLGSKQSKKVDIFLGENILCKYIRYLRGTDANYFDLVFVGQYLYQPNVEDHSLMVYVPNENKAKLISSGWLHSWMEPIKEKVPDVATQTRRQVDTPVPRKVQRSFRKQDVSRVAKKPDAEIRPLLLWVPRPINRLKGLIRLVGSERSSVIDSFQTHVDLIEKEGNLKSSFDIRKESTGRTQHHTLYSVCVEEHTFEMKEMDLSVVYSLFESIHKKYSFDSIKEAKSFGNTFLLFMVYPGRWFPKVLGTRNDLDGNLTMYVRRRRHANFYLSENGSDSWFVTPQSSNTTYEYT